MTASHPWDTIPVSAGGNYVKWETVGTTVAGIITSVVVGQSMENAPIPQLDVETKDGIVTISASQSDLKNKLVRSGAAVGQKIKVVYTGEQSIGAGKTMKTFTVKLGEPPVPVAAPVIADDDDDDDPF